MATAFRAEVRLDGRMPDDGARHAVLRIPAHPGRPSRPVIREHAGFAE